MTTICYDGKRIAIDRCTTTDGLRQENQKWRRLPDNRLVFIAGNAWMGELLCQRLAEGKLFEDWPAGQRKDEENALLIIASEATGEVLEVCTEPVFTKITTPCCWGSGAHIARGALCMGADAGQAVEAACRHDRFSGFGADVFDLG